MLTKQHSTINVSTRSHTGIVLEDEIMQHASEAEDANNREDNEEVTLLL